MLDEGFNLVEDVISPFTVGGLGRSNNLFQYEKCRCVETVSVNQ